MAIKLPTYNYIEANNLKGLQPGFVIAQNSNVDVTLLKDGMFDDSADSETLEYVFNLDTKTMQEIKKYNKNSNYYD